MSAEPTSITVPETLDGERLDRVLCLIWDLPRSEATALISSGAVRLEGRPMTTRARRVTSGQALEVALTATPEPAALAGEAGDDLPLVHVDDHVIVVDKPAGMVVHPGAGRSTGTLVQALLGRFPDLAAAGDPARPGIVHRLDKGTSGLLVVARTQDAYDSLVAQLSSRTVDRRYLALAWGTLDTDAGVIDAPVGRRSSDRTRMAVVAGGRAARTHYRVVSRHADVTLLECRLETGRTHQVRVHLAAIGHPVVGDARYGGSRPNLALNLPLNIGPASRAGINIGPASRAGLNIGPASRAGLERPFLHAAQLAFDHPGTGERCRFESPLPPDLEAVRAALR